MNRWVRGVAASCLGLALTVAVQPASASSARFTGYDNHNYANVGLRLLDVTLIKQVDHDGWVEATTRGESPPQHQFQDVARRAAERSAGPIVLDFENIWLRPKDGTVEVSDDMITKRVAIWKNLLTWTRQVARPGQLVGSYKFLNEVDLTRYTAQAKELAALESAFFPQLYTGSDYSHQTWTARVQNRLDKARTIDSAKPVLAYLWPQYETGLKGQWVPGDRWRAQLDTLLAKGANGFVIWGPANRPPPDADRQGWVSSTREFLDTLPPADR